MPNPLKPRRARPGPPSHEDHDLDPEVPSKTQLKRESDALQQLGKDLLSLPDSRLAQIEMDETLRIALRDGKKITAHEGKRRQLQYIGKLMRRVDPAPFEEAVAAFKLGHAVDQLKLHKLEALRDELLASDEALQAYISEHPGVDVQQLRSLVRFGAQGCRRPARVAQRSRLSRAVPVSESRAGARVMDAVRIGLLSCSDRASSGVYEDKGLPALKDWLTRALHNPIEFVERLIPDEREIIAATLRELVDAAGCELVLTTGGTGPAPRDVTPDATLEVADREMPGFGEQMRQISLRFVPTAILSRQTAVIRGRALILNLPGQPKAIAETLGGLESMPGIFAAVPYCLDLIGGPYLETDDSVCKAFRPKSAIRNSSPTA